MQLAKNLNKLRHNGTGMMPSILVISCCQRKLRKYSSSESNTLCFAARTGLLFGQKEDEAEESQVDLRVPLVRQQWIK